MLARGMRFGWRRVAAAAGGSSGPPAVLLGAAIACGATAAMAQLNAVTSSEQAETSALVARMTTAPTSTRRALIDTAIAGLKADGVWMKLDWLVLTAAHDAQAARLNWRAAKALAAVNAPTFTVDRGYAGDGSTAYLDCGEPPQAGGSFTQNSAGLGSWCNAAGTVEGRVLIGANATSYLSGRASGSLAGRVNSAVNTTGGSPSWTGHRAMVRGAATAVTIYRDGAVDGTATTASTAPDTNSLTVLSRSGTAHTNARIAAAWSGAALTDAEVAALHGRLNTYLTAIGAQ